jgi:hypothetical protein
MTQFYTYLWLREDGTPYYVGKGSGRRAFIMSSHRVNCPRIGNTVDRNRILVQSYKTERESFRAERFLISLYGRMDIGTGCLRNCSDGGEGASGFRSTPERNQKLRTANLGKKHSPATLIKLRECHLGVRLPAETRRKMSIARSGIPLSKEHREKLSRHAKNRSPEHRAKLGAAISRAMQGKPWSEKRRAACGES